MADIPEVPDFNNLQNLKIVINTESVENMIANLNGLHIEITGIKGFEVNKMINPQKFSTRREFYGSNINPTNNKKMNTTGNMGTSDYIKNPNMVF